MYFYSTGQNYVPNMKPPLGAVPNPHSSFSDGIVGDWPFWENGGTTVFDLSGNRNHGTLEGTAPSWRAGKFGPAVSLPRTGWEYIDVAASSSIDNAVHNHDLTVWFWWKTNDTATSDQGFFTIAVDAQNRMYCEWEAGNNFRMFLEVDDASKLNDTFSTSISTTNWYFIVVVMQGTTWSVYVNGVYDGGLSPTASLRTLTGSPYVEFGQGYFSGNNLDGLIDNMGMVARALSASEIALLYREPFIRYRWTLPELIHYYSAPVGNAGIMTPNTGFWGPTF